MVSAPTAVASCSSTSSSSSSCVSSNSSSERHVYRCQGCHLSTKLLSLSCMHTESHCVMCRDDTEWIIEEIQDKEAAFFNTGSGPDDLLSNDSNVKLLIGGQLFHTSVRTLLNHEPDSMFKALFSNRYTIADDNVISVDRPAKWFQHILDYCRQGSLAGDFSVQDLEELAEEADYFCLEKLGHHIAVLQAAATRDAARLAKTETLAAAEERGAQVAQCVRRLQSIVCQQNNIRSELEAVRECLQECLPPPAVQEEFQRLQEVCLHLVQTTNGAMDEGLKVLHHASVGCGEGAAKGRTVRVVAPPREAPQGGGDQPRMPTFLPPSTLHREESDEGSSCYCPMAEGRSEATTAPAGAAPQGVRPTGDDDDDPPSPHYHSPASPQSLSDTAWGWQEWEPVPAPPLAPTSPVFSAPQRWRPPTTYYPPPPPFYPPPLPPLPKKHSLGTLALLRLPNPPRPALRAVHEELPSFFPQPESDAHSGPSPAAQRTPSWGLLQIEEETAASAAADSHQQAELEGFRSWGKVQQAEEVPLPVPLPAPPPPEAPSPLLSLAVAALVAGLYYLSLLVIRRKRRRLALDC